LSVDNNKQLTKLTVTNNPKLESLLAYSCQLTNLTSNCPELSKLSLFSNQLTNFDFLNSIDITKLKKLDISRTNLSGSLEPLRNLSKLKKLDIMGTNLTGLEYLPESLEELYCNGELAKQLKKYSIRYDFIIDYQA